MAGIAGGAEAQARTGGLSLAPYVIESLDGTEHQAELGRLAVPERHGDPESRTIRIAFLRFRSTAAAPAAPIVFLPGGPGFPGTLLARTPAYLKLFQALRAQSDVIVLDQRGSGLSEPTLHCVTKSSLPVDALESEGKAAVALASMVRPCVRLARSDGARLEDYDTAESALDLEDVRDALGVGRLRLVAVSYGTELALEAIRRHPERIERAVLAGTRGPDMTVRLPSVSDLQLERFSALVAADSSWASTLPDFAGAARRAIQALTARPATMVVTDAKTRRAARVRLGPVGLQAILASDLSDWMRAPLLPALVASMERGDSTLLSRRVEEMWNGLGSGISVMQIAVECASGGSPERRSRAAREARASAFGNARNILLNPAFCDLVGAAELPASFREPVHAPTPVLFVSGTLDGVTPPFQAEEVRWGFPNGDHVLVENGWHETMVLPDVQRLVEDYLSGQDVRGRRLVLPRPRFTTVEEAKRLTAPR